MSKKNLHEKIITILNEQSDRVKELAESFSKDANTVAKDIYSELQSIFTNPNHKNKSDSRKIYRAFHKVGASYITEKPQGKQGTPVKIFAIGISPPQDRSDITRKVVWKKYNSASPSERVKMALSGEIKYTKDKEGITIETDESNRPIVLNNDANAPASLKGKPLIPNWSSFFLGVVLGDEGFSPLTRIYLTRTQSNPNNKNYSVDYNATFNKVEMSLYKTERGSLVSDGSQLTVFPDSEDNRYDGVITIINDPKIKPHVTDLASIQEWFDNSKFKEYSNGNRYGSDIVITSGVVITTRQATDTSSAFIKISSLDLPKEIRSNGYQVWIPNGMEVPAMLDEVVVVGVITQKATIYDFNTKQNLLAPDNKGDLSITAYGIFKLWSGTEEVPEDIQKEEVNSDIFTADMI